MLHFARIIIASMALFALQAVLAQEPHNLALAKSQIVKYYNSGEYSHDIDSVVNQAQQYLQTRLSEPDASHKKLAIVLDIDETSLSNYPNLLASDFGGSLKQMEAAEQQANDPAIKPTLALYQFAKDHHVAVFFVTGRHPASREATIKNLTQAGYHRWDGLTFKPKYYWTKSAALYKTKIRKELVAKGYDIVLNLGDQQSDLSGGFADKSFKLPGPFYFIP